MKRKILGIAAAASAAVLASAERVSAAYATVGVYDETGQANFVDSIASPSDVNGVATTGAADTLGGFKARAAAAFAADLGGVVNFDAGSGGLTGWTVTYGISQAKTLTVTGGVRDAGFSSSTEISGGREATAVNASNVDIADFAWAFAPAADERVTEVGITILGRNTLAAAPGSMFTLTATFSNGTTSSLSSNVATGTADDTFFSFAAPAGLGISSLAVDSVSNVVATYDDFAFVTTAVPEPASAGVLAVAVVVGLLARRRHSL